MKKFVRCVAIVLVLVTFMSPPASAVEFDSQWVSLLKYDSANTQGTGHSINFKGSGYLGFWLPETVYMRRLQGVLSANFSNLTSVSYSTSSSVSSVKYPLTLLDLGNGLYRFYSDSVSLRTSTIYLHFQNTSSTESTTLEVISFDYSVLRYSSFAETGKMQVGSNPPLTASVSGSALYTFPSASSGSYVVHFTCPNWQKYDAVSFFIYANGPDINSIVGRMGNAVIPATVSYLDSANWNESRTSVMVTLDLSGLDRTSTTAPEVELSGYRRTTDSSYSISLLGVTGYVCPEDYSEFSFWREFRDLLDADFTMLYETVDVYLYDIYYFMYDIFYPAISSGLDDIDLHILDLRTVLQQAITFFNLDMNEYWEIFLYGESDPADDFEDDIASQATEFQEITDTLDSVTKPPVDDLDPSIDSIVAPADVQNYTSFLSVLLGNNIFLSVCMMSLTFALVSYTVYGKR